MLTSLKGTTCSRKVDPIISNRQARIRVGNFHEKYIDRARRVSHLGSES